MINCFLEVIDMELQELLDMRQSIRRYKEGEIPEADLREIVCAAVAAPSAKNLQNWHFIAVKNREMIREIADIVTAKNEEIAVKMTETDEEGANRFRKFCKHFTVFWKETAAALVIVMATEYIPDGYRQYQLIDAPQALLDDLKLRRNPGMQSVGCALENFTLKALEKGYGSTILTSPNYAAPEIEAFLKKKDIFQKDDFFLACMIALGIPQEDQKSPSKKALDEVYTFIG